MFFVYVIKSTSSGILYKGQTNDLERRIIEHNSPANRYTSKDGHWELVYSEQFETRAEAMKREKFLKSGKGREFLKNTFG